MLTILAVILGQVPIPMGGYDGFKRGSSSAPIQLEIFVDLKCPDCKAVWPTIKAVADAYGDASLRLTVHTVHTAHTRVQPLPGT